MVAHGFLIQYINVTDSAVAFCRELLAIFSAVHLLHFLLERWSFQAFTSVITSLLVHHLVPDVNDSASAKSDS